MSHVVEPTRHKLTTRDFERLGAAGILDADLRIELIEGDLIDMPPIGPGHASVSNRLTRLLVLRAADAAIVSVANSIALPPWSMPQPDFTLLRPRADEYASALPGAADVLLAVEVADTTLRFDRTVKSRVYASHGVAEYWIVEVEARRMHVLRDPQPTAGVFASEQVLEPPFEVAPRALAQLRIASDEIWPSARV